VNATLRRPLTLVHTSDVHLDSAVGQGAEPSAPERGLARVIETVSREQADLLLIAGDLFDGASVPERAVEYAMRALEKLTCPVVLIPGNHDCYDDDSIYHTFDLRDAGSHVHPLHEPEGHVIELPEIDATVWGRALVTHDDRNRPLAAIPDRRAYFWHLGMAHGLVTDDRRDMRSSLIRRNEIADSGLDYLALGHVHVFRDVSAEGTRACYSGSPVPVHRDAVAGVAVVRLDPETGIEIERQRF